MMRLPRFRYFAPTSLTEAAKILAAEGPTAAVVAGGTDLYPNMKRRHQTPKVLVGMRKIPGTAEVAGSAEQGFVIGPMITLTRLGQHAGLRAAFPALTFAAGTVSTPLLRNMGTLGGNICLDTRCNYYDQGYEWRKSIQFCMKKDGDICWVAPGSDKCLAVSSTDTAPVLCALEARLTLQSVRGTREIAATELFSDDGIHYLTKAPDEVLTRIALPPRNGTRCAYWKLRRRGSFDFPVLAVAARVDLDHGGVVTKASLFFGGAGSRPMEAKAAAAVLVGRKPSAELIEQAATLAAGTARPMDNTDLVAGWRKQMARVFAQRALLEATGLGPAQGRA
jgi:4-hydroxybenzoyl-CoA reductase subunit beta